MSCRQSRRTQGTFVLIGYGNQGTFALATSADSTDPVQKAHSMVLLIETTG